MEKAYIIKAKNALKLADYLLIETYPLIKDPKVLLGVLTNLQNAYDNMIICLLSKTTKLLRTESGRLEQFVHYFKNKVTVEEMKSIQSVYDLVTEHKNSAVEFSRKQKLIMCNNNYEFHALTQDILKDFLRHAKNIHKKLLE